MHKFLAIAVGIITIGLLAPTVASEERGPKSHTHLSPWVQIHQTLHTYPLAIDGKDAALFHRVFAQDAFANYTGPLSNLTGIDAITTALRASVANVLSQHQLGTTVIDIHKGATTANSTTYFTASLFGTGDKFPTSSHVYLYGLYSDVLRRSDVGWRITSRQLVFMGPNVGDQDLLGG